MINLESLTWTVEGYEELHLVMWPSVCSDLDLEAAM